MFKKTDVFLIITLMVSAVVLLGWVVVAQDQKGTVVRVQVDGKVVGTYDLNHAEEIPIHSDGVDNVISITDGKVHMVHSNCPDQYCVKQGAIANVNQSIVCLPNRVVVTIEGADDTAIDVYIQ